MPLPTPISNTFSPSQLYFRRRLISSGRFHTLSLITLSSFTNLAATPSQYSISRANGTVEVLKFVDVGIHRIFLALLEHALAAIPVFLPALSEFFRP